MLKKEKKQERKAKEKEREKKKKKRKKKTKGCVAVVKLQVSDSCSEFFLCVLTGDFHVTIA